MIFHVIDDQPIICEFVSTVIESLNHEANFFHSSTEYLDYLMRDEYIRPDAIFTDVTMPQISGPEMLRRVKEKYPDQKFVIISGKLLVEQECSDGYCMFLSKPFGSRDIEDVIRVLEK